MVDFSDKIKNSESEIKLFLRTKMYNNKNVLEKNNKGKIIIKNLFKKIRKNPKKFLAKESTCLIISTEQFQILYLE